MTNNESFRNFIEEPEELEITGERELINIIPITEQSREIVVLTSKFEPFRSISDATQKLQRKGTTPITTAVISFSTGILNEGLGIYQTDVIKIVTGALLLGIATYLGIEAYKKYEEGQRQINEISRRYGMPLRNRINQNPYNPNSR